jgi:glutamate-1-semialdehyde 2,1-aminomutase
MDVLNARAPRLLFPHAGTFSGNPVSLTAGLVAMEKFDRAAVARLNALADRARLGIEHAIRQTGVSACVTGAGSMFRVHMKAAAPRNYREAHTSPEETRRLRTLLSSLFDQGFVLINSGSAALSTPMGETEIDALVGAMRSAFERIAAAG